MRKIILIGGYPKGFSEPFHLKTHSGRILRTILKKCKYQPILLNLWTNERQETNGELSAKMIKLLGEYLINDYLIIALGKYQELALKKYHIKCTYLPHPAARRKIDREKLQTVLEKILS